MKINPQAHPVNDAKNQRAERAALKSYDQKSMREVGRGKSDSSTSSAEFSARSHEMNDARSVATSAPDVREAKIAELRRRIENNEYNVKPEAVADRLVNEHMATEGIF